LLLRLGWADQSRFSHQFAEWEFTFIKDGVSRRVIQAALSTALRGEPGSVSGTTGLVYYSSPTRYYDVTSEVYLHALNDMDFAS